MWMKVVQFVKSRGGRWVLAGAVLLWVAAGMVYAHGEQERERFDKRRRWDAAALSPGETGPARGAVPMAAGGFIGPLVTTGEALAFADKRPVRLRGTIVQALGDERYEFRDGAGTITVKIGRRAWNGVLVDNREMVEITGAVEKSFSRRVVKARSIQKIQPALPTAGTLPAAGGN
ncbi:MAG: NirD/YgiW/YdeI family stress tolerance protein [Treponema sp.]|jgi:uncharacterized protein (TIGR00156 family)|nr:NirD/YgiW/YdeI family stress tolerance protein [Treponema sp.]